MPTDMHSVVAIVCGGRDYSDGERLDDELDLLHAEYEFELIVHGGARGADTLARNWAYQRGVKCRCYRADWECYGRSAGHIRNQQMLDSEKPDLVIAFSGGRGTADMVRRARAEGVLVVEIGSKPDAN